ncbi:MAG TPA: hypothetical protein VMA86_06355 [Acetobacteraceae bacterium]|nr:hypothetical protein [Acetobacteraceae bacterium]
MTRKAQQHEFLAGPGAPGAARGAGASRVVSCNSLRLAACSAMLLVAGSLPFLAAPSTASAECRLLCNATGSFSGTWEATDTENVGIPSNEVTRTVSAFKWGATFQGSEEAWRLTELAGKLRASFAAAPSESCESTLSIAPDGIQQFQDYDVMNIRESTNASAEPNGWLIFFEVPIDDAEQIFTTTSSHGFCTGEGGYVGCTADDEGPCNPFWRAPLAASCGDFQLVGEGGSVLFPREGGYSYPIHCEAEGMAESGTVSYSVKLNATLSFTSGVVSPLSTAVPSSGSAPPPPQLPPQKQQAAQRALEDLRNTAIPNLERYCGTAAAGLLGAGAGVLTGNAYLAVAGGLTAAALNPFCGAALTRVVNDYKIHNDPPLQSIGVIARPARSAITAKLPSCKRYHGTRARFCKRLRSAYARLVTTAQNVASSTTAIEETVSRERAAYEQRNEPAMNAQNSDLVTLMGEAPTEYAAEAAAGKDVARVLRGAHLFFKLSKKQSAKAIAHAEGDLAKQGISTAELSSVEGSVLKPAASDLLADLEHI